MIPLRAAEAPVLLSELESARTPAWYVRGYAVFHTLFALTRAGFFDDLAAQGPLELAGYARRKGLDLDVLEALARYLYGLGILDREQDGRYGAAVEVRGFDLDLVRMFYAYDPLFRELASLLSGEKIYGRDVARDPRLDAEASGRICRNYSYPEIVRWIARRPVRGVLDLGCGSGELLIEICRRCPETLGIGIDLSPEVADLARRSVAAAGLGHRIRIETADILEIDGGGAPVLPEEEIDLALSSAVFHEFAYQGTDRLVQALRAVRRRLPRATLLLAEALEQGDAALRRNPTPTLEHHLFHRLSRQGIARAGEWERAFAEAGYRLEELIELQPSGVIFVLCNRKGEIS